MIMDLFMPPWWRFNISLFCFQCWITGGGHAKWFFVLARNSDADKKTPAGKAFTAFVVDGDTPGITRGKKVRFKICIQKSFETCEFCLKNRLNHPDEIWPWKMNRSRFIRIPITGENDGSALLGYSNDYLRRRESSRQKCARSSWIWIQGELIFDLWVDWSFISQVAMGAFDMTRPGVAAGALGIMWRALDESTKWVR